MRIASMRSISRVLVLSISLLLGSAICTVTGRAQETPKSADPPSDRFHLHLQFGGLLQRVHRLPAGGDRH